MNKYQKLSTLFEPIFQQAVDKAIEQHRLKGESIAISQDGKAVIIPPEKIIPLKDKYQEK